MKMIADARARATTTMLFVACALMLHCGGEVVDAPAPADVQPALSELPEARPKVVAVDAGQASDGIWCDPEPDSCGSIGGQLCGSANPADQPPGCESVGDADAGSVDGLHFWCCPAMPPVVDAGDPCHTPADPTIPAFCTYVPPGEDSACGRGIAGGVLCCCDPSKADAGMPPSAGEPDR